MRWLLLIYSVPAEPSRKRATIWREIKKAGAIYLRDGVCALPQRDETAATLALIAVKVEEFGGQATLARGVELDEGRTAWLLNAADEARRAEYDDIRGEITAFLAHIRREQEHREFSFKELEELDQDLTKLRRWSAQIAAREFTGSAASSEVSDLLAQCQADIGIFLEEAFRQEQAAP
jgi:ChrB-like protein